MLRFTWIIILFIFFTYSCKPDPILESRVEDQTIDSTFVEQEKYISTIHFDPTTPKPEKSRLLLELDKARDSPWTSCLCEKNIPENRIAIQLISDFESQIIEKDFENSQSQDIGITRDSLRGHRIFLTFFLKDDKLETIQFMLKSDKANADGTYQRIDSLDKYHIVVTDSTYKIAQNIWGKFELELPEDLHSDLGRKVGGEFFCNNWQIMTHRNEQAFVGKRSLLINPLLPYKKTAMKQWAEPFEWDNYDDCSCRFNKRKDSLFIKTHIGNGMGGEQIALKIGKNLGASAFIEFWSDHRNDRDYVFRHHEIELSKNPFEEGKKNLIISSKFASAPRPELYGDRILRKVLIRCKY